MSTFSLTRGSEAALGMLASQAGSETLLLTQPARELRAELSIEPFTSDSGDQLLAVLFMREQRHSMTLQRNDGANVQHLADWVEAAANGTLDTAEAIPQRADPGDLAAATAAFHAAAQELNAAVEPAPAQDEQSPEQMLSREQIENIARKVHGDCIRLPGATYQNAAEAAVMYTLERIARPAQTEQQPSVVPNGWQLVPMEPTHAMREAFHAATERYEDGFGESPDSQWHAMLRAARATSPTV